MSGQDRDLTAAFLAGEGDAVAAVEGWIKSAAWPYKTRLGHRHEDIVQDALREVLQALSRSSFRGDSSFKTFVWRIANNTCLDQMRSRRRWQWTDLEEVERGTEAMRSAPDTGRRLAAWDLMVRVLSASSEECRRLWAMVAEGLSYKEMSVQLAVSEGALRVRVLRCRKRAIEARDRLLSGGGSAAGAEA